MTFIEEQTFYDAGISAIGQLAIIPDGAVGAIAAERVARLRVNAKEFNARRRRSAVGSITLVTVALIGLGASSSLFKQDAPAAGLQVELPPRSK